MFFGVKSKLKKFRFFQVTSELFGVLPVLWTDSSLQCGVFESAQSLRFVSSDQLVEALIQRFPYYSLKEHSRSWPTIHVQSINDLLATPVLAFGCVWRWRLATRGVTSVPTSCSSGPAAKRHVHVSGNLLKLSAGRIAKLLSRHHVITPAMNLTALRLLKHVHCQLCHIIITVKFCAQTWKTPLPHVRNWCRKNGVTALTW